MHLTLNDIHNYESADTQFYKPKYLLFILSGNTQLTSI
jgi:hypothetical protein